MSTKRLKDQITADILTTCRGEGKTKTKIVYASGLNFNTILPYLISLSKNGLIEIIPGKYPLYKITPKGEDALIHLNALEELMPKYVTEDVMDLQSNGNAIPADKQNLELSQNGKIWFTSRPSKMKFLIRSLQFIQRFKKLVSMRPNQDHLIT